MYDSNSKGISYTAGFFMLIAFAIAGITFSGEVARLAWVAMTGKNYAGYLSGMSDPAYSNGFYYSDTDNGLFNKQTAFKITRVFLQGNY